MKRILLFAACAALWSSCSDDDSASGPKDPNQIRVKAAIASITPGPASAPSRTTITGSTAAWADGDAIGLFCAEAKVPGVNVEYTLSGSTWSTASPLYWLDGTTNHKFLAYAPYAAGNTATTSVKVPAINTQTGTIASAQDLLISSNLYATGVPRGNGSIGLVFTHALSLVELKMQIGAGIAASTTLTSFTLAGAAAEKLYTSDAASTIDLSTGTVTPGATTNTATVAPTAGPILSATPVSVYALLLPGTYTGPTLTVSIKDGGTTAFTTATISVGTTLFEAAKKYTYTVTITRTAITISNPTITDWVTVNGNPLNPGI